MDKLIEWFKAYIDEITWWTIGWLSFAFFDSLGRGHWGLALLDAFLIYFNYRLWKGRYE